MSEIYEEVDRVATRELKWPCPICKKKVHKGQEYVSISDLTDGLWWHESPHRTCLDLADRLIEKTGWSHGDICLDEVLELATREGVSLEGLSE